jgi:hypothetical protein
MNEQRTSEDILSDIFVTKTELRDAAAAVKAEREKPDAFKYICAKTPLQAASDRWYDAKVKLDDLMFELAWSSTPAIREGE